MKAKVSYNDFVGTVAADISDELGKLSGNDLERIGDYFNLDKNRFKIVGISIYGTNPFTISLICVDNERSKGDQDYIVKMMIDTDNDYEVLDFLFKRLHIVLHERLDTKYPHLGYDDEVRFSDYHSPNN